MVDDSLNMACKTIIGKKHWAMTLSNFKQMMYNTTFWYHFRYSYYLN